jgi:predicted transcriptional regulator
MMNPIDASKIMGDEYTVKIMIEAARHPASVLDISYKLNIPLSACKDRIKLLEENDLVHCVKMPVTHNGTHAYVYITDYYNMKTLFSNFEEEFDFIDTIPITTDEAKS